MKPTTKQSLGIFWYFSEKEGQEEVEGLYVCGCWCAGLPDKEFFGSFSKTWSDGKVEASVYQVDADNEKSITISTRILEWPREKNWHPILEECLKYLIVRGALVAWCGGEACGSTPQMLDPIDPAGHIYAAYSKQNGFVCNSGLNDEHQYLRNDQLELFKGELMLLRKNYKQKNPASEKTKT